jgi:biotin carboxyl carrier protein
LNYAIEIGSVVHLVEISAVDEDSGEVVVTATVNGRPHAMRLHRIAPGAYWFLEGGQSREAAVQMGEGETTVEIDDRRFRLRVLDRRARIERGKTRDAGEHGSVEVRAPMPGKVVRVLVDEGALVEPGQAVAVIEAMKMQNEVKAPKAGNVHLRVKSGQAVKPGTVVFTVG